MSIADIATVIGVLGTAVGIVSGVLQLSFGRRTQLASQAISYLDRIHQPGPKTALSMLDYDGYRITFDGRSEHISHSELAFALTPHTLLHGDRDGFDAKQVYIRDRFDELFDQLDIIEHARTVNVARLDDLTVGLRYWADRILGFPAAVTFLRAYGYKCEPLLRAAATPSGAATAARHVHPRSAS